MGINQTIFNQINRFYMKKVASISMLSLLTVLFSCEKKETVVYQQPSTSTSDPSAPAVTEPVQNTPSGTTQSNQQSVSTPAVVTSFLNKHYPNIAIAKNEIKTSAIDGKTYEVTLNDGTEIELKENGEWKEIKDIKGIPSAIFPSTIKSYLQANYNNITVEKIEKESRGYKVELINNIDLEFDNNGKFVRIDP